ncbi:MAG: aminoacyl-tRNA hydrolase [Minisyncoccia bacterium]|jgi:PTH1 family peptidyl-tRNA hydrolase
MMFTIAGLGNPGKEYEGTRHNSGRIILDHIRKEWDGEFEPDKKLNALVSEVKIGKEKATLVAPDTFMNNSGKAIGKLIKNEKAAEKLVVIYDDFQLPLGRMKISFNKSAGGHRGLDSVIKAVKTEAFTRIRIGTAPANSKGEAKVPHGDEKINKFILGKFKPDELKTIKKVAKRAAEAVEMIVKEGREKAMSVFNQA